MELRPVSSHPTNICNSVEDLCLTQYFWSGSAVKLSSKKGWKHFFLREKIQSISRRHIKMPCVWKTWSKIDPSEQNKTLNFLNSPLEAVFCYFCNILFFPGCTAGGLSLNSKTFTKMLQSCLHRCEHHRIILEAEERYRGELRRVAAGDNRSATHQSMNLCSILGTVASELHLKFWTFVSLLLIVLLF